MTLDDFPHPPTKPLPVSRGADVVMHVRRGTDQAWPDGTRLILQFTAGNRDQRFDFAAAGEVTEVRAESEVVDQLRDGDLWALLVSWPGTPTTEQTVVNGEVVRYDGRG